MGGGKVARARAKVLDDLGEGGVEDAMAEPSLSIITAVHNGLAMNQIYWETLCQNTSVPFELILVDNHSTDGSENYFRKLAENPGENHRVVYLRSETNQSYPASQIQGMAKASADVLVFLNNDVWMPAGWELPFLSALEENPYLVLSPSGQEAQPAQRLSDSLKNRWRRVTWISKVWQKISRISEKERLLASVRWMYGDLEHFESPTPEREPGHMPGIKGDCVVFHKKLLQKLPEPWNVRIEAADWHLYLSVADLHERDPEVPLPRVLFSSYVHHFGRYSARQKFEPLNLTQPFLSIAEVWGDAAVRRLWWGYRLPEH